MTGLAAPGDLAGDAGDPSGVSTTTPALLLLPDPALILSARSAPSIPCSSEKQACVGQQAEAEDR
jgi:hypothetical protein